MKTLLYILNDEKQLVHHELGTKEELREKVLKLLDNNDSGGTKAYILPLTVDRCSGTYTLPRVNTKEEAPKKKRGRPPVNG